MDRGHCNPHVDIPKLAKLYRDGQLKLDELITARYLVAPLLGRRVSRRIRPV